MCFASSPCAARRAQRAGYNRGVRVGGALWCFVVVAGCGGDDAVLLVVDVRTELAPGVEFERARTLVRAPGSEELLADVDAPADPARDYAAGARVAEVELEPGGYVVRVELTCGGGVVAAEMVDVAVEDNLGVIVEVVTTGACPSLDGGARDAGSPGDAGVPDAAQATTDAGMDNCVSDADRAILERTDHGPSMNETFDQVVDRRTRQCILALGVTSGDRLEECVRDGLVNDTDISQMCSECYARAAECSSERCAGPCYLSGTADSCRQCRCDMSCEAIVEECSGVPRMMCS